MMNARREAALHLTALLWRIAEKPRRMSQLTVGWSDKPSSHEVISKGSDITPTKIVTLPAEVISQGDVSLLIYHRKSLQEVGFGLLIEDSRVCVGADIDTITNHYLPANLSATQMEAAATKMDGIIAKIEKLYPESFHTV